MHGQQNIKIWTPMSKKG